MHSEKTEEDAPDKKQILEISLIVIVGLAILISWSRILLNLFPLDIAGLLAALFGGLPLFKRAYLDLKARSVTAEVAMTVGMIAALSIGEFLSAAVIAFFMMIAELLEEVTMGKGRSAIRELMGISPKKAIVKRNGAEVEVNISEVRLGDIVIVKSGERIPVDGAIVAGQASVNQAPITGESMPVEKGVDDEVFTGTINELGLIQVKATKVGTDTTLARIIELVEDAERSKAPIQRTADRFATYFVPVVLAIAFLAFIATRNVNSSIAVVVVACPCAIVLATPLAVVASVGKAAKKGVIVKGGIYLEELGQIDTVAFDKTGTLTTGEPVVTDVEGFDGHDKSEVIALAATAEKHSEHPLAKAILRKAQDYGVEISEHQDCQVMRGKGIVATCNGQTLIIGRRELLNERGIRIPPRVESYMVQEEENGKTAMLVAHDDKVCGVISVSDILRKDAVAALKQLKARGIRLVMLTGDNQRTAQAIAKQVGINEVFAEMLPEEKVDVVKELVKKGSKVAMVGDGINDAPALAQASVGIAMGAAGTDVAIEAADVALMTDDLARIPEAIAIGDKAFKVIKQNIATSIVFNVVGITLASMGILSPTLAAAAHALPDFILFLNSSRLIRG
jgi:heavy metal translocating P-type ATPase